MPGESFCFTFQVYRYNLFNNNHSNMIINIINSINLKGYRQNQVNFLVCGQDSKKIGLGGWQNKNNI